MLSKKEVKYIQSLAHKKNRDEYGCFIAEGPKIVSELISLIPDKIATIYATKEWIEANKPVLQNLPVQEITEYELEKLSQLQTPNGVLAIIKQFQPEVPTIKNSFALYLDAVQDPGNFGTIIRIADWFGVPHIVCSPGCADMYNPKVVQATMASIARVNIYYDMDKSWLQQQQIPIYAAVLHGRSIYEHSKVAAGILIIGNESKGIDEKLQELASHKITIPRKGAAESLNAAVATGIILSHIV